MSVSRFPHAHVPFAESESSRSLDEDLRPGLRRAYPLPADGDRDERFQHLLRALAERDRFPRRAVESDAMEGVPAPRGWRSPVLDR